MSPTAPPPQLPPQVSPDGKWVWDGRQWQPVAVANWEPAAAAVIPQAVAPVPRPVPAAAPAYVAPEEVLMPAPAYNFPVVEPVSPPWVKPSHGVSTYLYVAGGAVLLIMVMVVLNSLSVVPWHFFGSDPVPSASPTPTAAIPPATTRTEYVQADRFLTYTLQPPLDAVSLTLPGLKVCAGTLSNSCLTAITTTDQEMKKLLSVIDHASVPPCIATPMVKLRADLGALEAALQLATKAYDDNNVAELKQGLNRFGYLGQYLATDGTSIAQAETKCNTDVQGP